MALTETSCNDFNLQLTSGLRNVHIIVAALVFKERHASRHFFAGEVMTIAAKDGIYKETHRVAVAGGLFAVFDGLQGEGGDFPYLVPCTRFPGSAIFQTPDVMKSLRPHTIEISMFYSTDESPRFFEMMTVQMAKTLRAPGGMASFSLAPLPGIGEQ